MKEKRALWIVEDENRLCSQDSLKANQINLARLLLAVLVIFSHSYTLTGVGDAEPLSVFSHGQMWLGSVAVSLFFVISGFLILRSWLSSEMREYFQRRILRIYPGFIVAMIVSAALAAAASTSILEYWRELPHKGFLFSLFSLHYGVMDVPTCSFPGIPFHAVNGSLWTIPIEFGAYVFIAVYGVFGLYKYRWFAVVVVFAILANYEHKVFKGMNPNAVWGLACSFAFGSALYLFRDVVPRSRVLAIICATATVFGMLKSPWLDAVFPFTMTYLTFYLILRKVHPRLAWTNRIDLSYGTYLYAFVIQQSLVYWAHVKQPILLFFLAAPVTLLFASLSWFLIEKRCLGLKKHDFTDYDPVGLEGPQQNPNKLTARLNPCNVTVSDQT
jgi:peptidoglycan/LPS O-acetylase OafA/YrhL